MRRLCRSVTEMALLAALAWGCGSTAGDSLTLRFTGFNSLLLTQGDSVRETSADVDVVAGGCSTGEVGATITAEPFTQTIINAVFINEEAADITLQRYRIYLPPTINGVPTGLGEFIEQTVGKNIPGGSCENITRSCATNDDCGVAGVLGSCVHSSTIVGGLVLFDFATKQLLNRPQFFGVASNITIQFFGTDDANQSFEVTTSYVATFGDFNNCPTGQIEIPLP